MRVTKSTDILSNLKNNRYSTWCSDDAETPGHRPSYAANRLQHSYAEIHVEKKFDLTESAGIYAMGSCFAREVEGQLAVAGFNVLSFDGKVFDPVTFASPHEWGQRSFLNRYTTASMLLEVQRITGEIELPDDCLVMKSGNNYLDLHFHQDCDPGDLSLVARRRRKTKEVGTRILTADVVILTLGLVEAWYDTEAERYINYAPEMVTLRRSDRFELHELDFHDNLKNLETIYEVIRAKNKSAKFVITVSPIPLTATFTKNDIVIANTRSKSILRAVADDFCSRHEESLYFPSYEIVMNSHPAHAWKGDRRHVTRTMVTYIISSFKSIHGLPTDEKEQVVFLTDFTDDRRSIEDSVHSGVSFENDYVMLHPFAGDAKRRAALRFKNIMTQGLTSFVTEVQVGHADAMPVVFEVAVCLPGKTEPIRQSFLPSQPMVTGTFELDLLDLSVDKIDVLLFTSMQNAKDSANYAWAYFMAPRLIYAT